MACPCYIAGMNNMNITTEEPAILHDTLNSTTPKVTKGEMDKLLETPLPQTHYGLPIIVLDGICYSVATSREKALAAYRENIKAYLWDLCDEVLLEATGVEDLNSIGNTNEELYAAIDKHYGLERFLDKCMENRFLYFDEHEIKTPWGYSLYPFPKGVAA